MSIEFRLPELGEGIDSAEVVGISVSEGDMIEADANVMELETDKAIAELPCPHAGKIIKVHVSEGDTIKIGQILLTIEEKAEKPKSKKETKPPKLEEKAGKPEEQAEKPKAEAKHKPAEKDAAASTASQAGPATFHAGPATRRLAHKLGVDLHKINGSGPGGRITQEDVVEAHDRSAQVAQPSGPSQPQLPDFEKYGPVKRERLNKIARTAMKNLSTSWRMAPHVTQHDQADITELETSRRRYLAARGQSGPKITLTAIAIKAVTTVLEEFPRLNASLDAEKEELVLKQYYNIGVAVDTEDGLLVPVIRDVGRKSIVELAVELDDLVQRARQRKLSLEDMEGGTFTVSNQGGIGGIAFTPIVNFPQVAILGISRARKELQMIDGRPEERLMLPLSLSYDHRAVNGADAARFLVRLSTELSDSFQLLIRT